MSPILFLTSLFFKSFAGPRTVLFDLRVIDDPYVQRRADGDGAILHVRGRGVRQSHGERRGHSKLRIIMLHKLHQVMVKPRSGEQIIGEKQRVDGCGPRRRTKWLVH